jgi:hypothetical protein
VYVCSAHTYGVKDSPTTALPFVLLVCVGDPYRVVAACSRSQSFTLVNVHCRSSTGVPNGQAQSLLGCGPGVTLYVGSACQPSEAVDCAMQCTSVMHDVLEQGLLAGNVGTFRTHWRQGPEWCVVQPRGACSLPGGWICGSGFGAAVWEPVGQDQQELHRSTLSFVGTFPLCASMRCLATSMPHALMWAVQWHGVHTTPSISSCVGPCAITWTQSQGSLCVSTCSSLQPPAMHSCAAAHSDAAGSAAGMTHCLVLHVRGHNYACLVHTPTV